MKKIFLGILIVPGIAFGMNERPDGHGKIVEYMNAREAIAKKEETLIISRVALGFACLGIASTIPFQATKLAPGGAGILGFPLYALTSASDNVSHLCKVGMSWLCMMVVGEPILRSATGYSAVSSTLAQKKSEVISMLNDGNTDFKAKNKNGQSLAQVLSNINDQEIKGVFSRVSQIRALENTNT